MAFVEGYSLGSLFNISTLLQTRLCSINDISPVPCVSLWFLAF